MVLVEDLPQNQHKRQSWESEGMFPSQATWRTSAEGVCSVFQRFGCACSPKSCFTGWVTPGWKFFQSLPCSFQGLLDCFIPEECGCHSSSHMENPCLIWLWIQSTALGCKPRPFIGMRSWLRARRGERSSGSFHSRWGTERSAWPRYSLAGPVLFPLTISPRKDPNPCGFLLWAAHCAGVLEILPLAISVWRLPKLSRRDIHHFIVIDLLIWSSSGFYWVDNSRLKSGYWMNATE